MLVRSIFWYAEQSQPRSIISRSDFGLSIFQSSLQTQRPSFHPRAEKQYFPTSLSPPSLKSSPTTNPIVCRHNLFLGHLGTLVSQPIDCARNRMPELGLRLNLCLGSQYTLVLETQLGDIR